jgi:hypothetical protein
MQSEAAQLNLAVCPEPTTNHIITRNTDRITMMPGESLLEENFHAAITAKRTANPINTRATVLTGLFPPSPDQINGQIRRRAPLKSTPPRESQPVVNPRVPLWSKQIRPERNRRNAQIAA